MRLVPMLVLALLVSAPIAARAESLVTPQTGPPDEGVATMVAAERAFNALAAKTNIRDAFFENMADQSILFRPGPVNGKEFFRARPSNPGPVLSWYPSYAELAGTGDLGWTLGPWEYRSTKDKPAEAWGHFATIWQRQTDGKWKVLFDEGHSCARPPQDSLAWARLTARTKDGDVVHLAQFTGAHSKLLATDRAYSEALLAHGLGGALEKYADDDVRLLREDHPAVAGARAAGKEFAHEWDGGAEAWDMKAGAISKGVDLAFTYGTVSLPKKGKDLVPARKVFRIWRAAPDGGWKLALDVTNPIPPPPPATPKTP